MTKTKRIGPKTDPCGTYAADQVSDRRLVGTAAYILLPILDDSYD